MIISEKKMNLRKSQHKIIMQVVLLIITTIIHLIITHLNYFQIRVSKKVRQKIGFISQ